MLTVSVSILLDGDTEIRNLLDGDADRRSSSVEETTGDALKH